MSYMCSYNAINGVPACANRELLTDILRNTWNFNGFVVSDCGKYSGACMGVMGVGDGCGIHIKSIAHSKSVVL